MSTTPTPKLRDVILIPKEGADELPRFRICHIDRTRDRVVVIELRREKRKEEARRRRAEPKPRGSRRRRAHPGGRNDGLQDWEYSDLLTQLGGSAELEPWRPHPRTLRSVEDMTPREVFVRNRDWDRIRPLVTGPDAELIFNVDYRGRLMTERAQALKLDVGVLYRILRRYFENGMQGENSVLPDWVKRAGKAHARRARAPTSEFCQGEFAAPRRARSHRCTPADYARFRIAHTTFYKKQRKSMSASYWLMLASPTLYDAGTYDERRCKFTFHSHTRLADVPSERQYRHWTKRHTDPIDSLRTRSRGTQFERDMRGLGGKQWLDSTGPTEQYQIDETPTPINLVSDVDPRIKLGTGWLVAVISTWSQELVGLIATYRPPSFAVTRDALLHAFSEKVSSCARVGLEITEEDWPCHHVCANICADRQSLLVPEAEESLTRGSLKIGIDSPPPSRPDWKGYVERIFGHIQSKSHAEGDPAAYPREGLELGERHPLFKATETLSDFTRKAYVIGIEYNKNHRLERSRLDKVMLRDGVENTPEGLWLWGLENARTGEIAHTQEEIYFGLLRRGTASVRSDGIWFTLPGKKTAHAYTCALAVEQQWFAKARNGKVDHIPVLFDPMWADYIWIVRDDGSLVRCDLMAHEQAAHGMRLDEITDVQDRHFELSEEAKRRAAESEITIAATNARTAASAAKRAKQAGPAPTDKEQKAAQAKSRSAEIAAELAARNQHLAVVLNIPQSVKKAVEPEPVTATAEDDDFALLEQIAREESETDT